VNHRALSRSKTALTLAFGCDLFQFIAPGKKAAPFPGVTRQEYLA
jgi:hypothetical protein